MVAFAVSQFVDAAVFVVAGAKTAGRMLWVRAVGSTVVSQLIDTFVINVIAFRVSGKLSLAEVVELSVGNYAYKFIIAVLTLPLIYLGHSIVDRYLRRTTAESVD